MRYAVYNSQQKTTAVDDNDSLKTGQRFWQWQPLINTKSRRANWGNQLYNIIDESVCSAKLQNF